MRAFERFCYRYERYGIRNLLPILLAAQAAMAVFQLMSNQPLFLQLSFQVDLVLAGQWWRVVTFLLVPPNMNLLFLVIYFFFGVWVTRTLEARWGALKLNIYFVSAIMVALGFSVFSHGPLDTMDVFSSCLLALCTLCPDEQVTLYFVIPLKMKYLSILVLFRFFQPLVSSLFAGRVPLHVFLPLVLLAHYLVFFGGTLLAGLRRMGGRTRRRPVISFQKEAKRYRESRNYIHKCEVCGRTDADAPQLEFRYCSLCSGYACYCSEHLFNHVHKMGK